jgi:hypothetical protein
VPVAATHLKESNMSAEKKEPEISIADKAAILSSFWTAPDSSLFPAEVVAVVLDKRVSTLAKERSSGDGPKFMTGRDSCRSIFYRKGEVVHCLEASLIEVSNAAQGTEYRAQAARGIA